MTAQPVTTHPPAEALTIGRDIGPFGRVFRLVSGALVVVGETASLLTGEQASTSGLLQTGGYVLGLAAFYLVLHRLLGRVVVRVDPFVTTVLVLAPLGVFTLSIFPAALHVAVGLYIGASLILSAGIRYGGCEVVALPTLLFHRRDVVYCPINILDAAERPLHRAATVLGRVAALVALVVAGYYLVVSALLEQFNVADPVSPRWSLLLLGPAALLAWRAWRAGVASRRDDALLIAVGSAALVSGSLVLVGVVSADLVFAVAVLIGLLLAGIRTVTALLGRRRGSAPPAPESA